MTLIDILNSKLTRLNNLDSKWVTFILDHKKYIISKSDSIIITNEMISHYQHKLHNLLRENGVQDDIQWIARMLNSINDLTVFNQGDRLIIPEKNLISELYRKFQTSTSPANAS